jgi:DNA-binding PadR family transcriptional regulator
MPHAPFRLTLPTQLVLRTLLTEPGREMYGLEICDVAELPSGTIHPILARIEAAGWLTSRLEVEDPRALGRPRRRYYRLTPDGAERARDALAQAHTTAKSVGRLRPGLAGSL